MLRKVVLIAALAAGLGGCATDVYDKDGATQADFDMDQGNCEMFVLGQAPYIPPAGPPNYIANTTYSGNQAYTNIQAVPNPVDGYNQFGAAIGNAIRQKAAMRSCMASKGYVLR